MHHPLAAIEREFAVDRTMDADVKARLIGLPGWRGFNNPWMPEDDSEVDYSYINLVVNPERFTGYKVGHGTGGGDGVHVWVAC